MRNDVFVVEGSRIVDAIQTQRVEPNWLEGPSRGIAEDGITRNPIIPDMTKRAALNKTRGGHETGNRSRRHRKRERRQQTKVRGSHALTLIENTCERDRIHNHHSRDPEGLS